MQSRAKTIVVAGATGGIGGACLRELSRQGARLIALGKDASKLRELQDIDNAVYATYSADFTDSESVQELGERLKDEPIDWIVHAAGYLAAPENKASLAPTFSVNVHAPIALAATLEEKGLPSTGHIFISSTAGLRGNSSFPMYSASKAAITMFGQTLAQSYEGSPRKSIVICPGPTDTAMRERAFGDASKHQSPDVIASLVAEIVYTDAYGNGDVLVIRDAQTSVHSRLS